MANKNPKTENLTSYKPKWNAGKTKTIRVPIAIAPLVLEAAREIDSNGQASLLKQIEYLRQENQELLLQLKHQKIDITDTSELKVFLTLKENVKKAIAEGFAVPANKGGQIKKCLARVGDLLGYKVERNSHQVWSIKN